MTITQDKDVDIFVASRIGSFKHIKYHTDPTKNNKRCIENLVDIKLLQKGDAVTCMQWADDEQTEILLGRLNQQVQVYSTVYQTFKTHTLEAPGHIVGLGRYKRKLLAASSSGVVRVWSKKTEELVQTGGKLDVMRVCGDDATLFATGGEENDLKIWRIGSPEPIFTAKNLPHDFLQLRRPVWVSGVSFAPKDSNVVAVCSRNGYVRLYDSRAQRRPVINVEFPNMAATCIVPGFEERQFIVGFGRGQIHNVDLRASRPDKGFKGCAGAVTDISAVSEGRLLVSTSLDRHLRVHKYDTKECVYRQYLTSKLSCVLAQTATSTPLRDAPPEVKAEAEAEAAAEAEAGDSELAGGDDLDLIFDRMDTIGEKPKKKESLLDINEPSAKKLKPSTEGSTEGTSEDAIVQLLRSTEKQKRKREQKKREKKAKSVFHNA